MCPVGCPSSSRYSNSSIINIPNVTNCRWASILFEVLGMSISRAADEGHPPSTVNSNMILHCAEVFLVYSKSTGF